MVGDIMHHDGPADVRVANQSRDPRDLIGGGAVHPSHHRAFRFVAVFRLYLSSADAYLRDLPAIDDSGFGAFNARFSRDLAGRSSVLRWCG